jgi:hypothetical protein
MYTVARECRLVRGAADRPAECLAMHLACKAAALRKNIISLPHILPCLHCRSRSDAEEMWRREVASQGLTHFLAAQATADGGGGLHPSHDPRKQVRGVKQTF